MFWIFQLPRLFKIGMMVVFPGITLQVYELIRCCWWLPW